MAICLLGGVALPACGADAIDTDGPDFVESSQSVGAKHVQIETNLYAESQHLDGVKTTTLNTPTLLRLGVSRDWELRLETDGYTRIDTTAPDGQSSSRHDTPETAIGTKWHMQDGGDGKPAVAWLFHVEAPNSMREFRGTGLQPSVRSVINWDLPNNFDLSVMPGVRYGSDEIGRRYVAGILGVVVSKWWTPHFRTFAEFAGERLARPPEDNQVFLNLGAAYLLDDDWQLGARVSYGASQATPRRALLLAVARRY